MSSTQSPIRPVKNDKAPLIRTVLVFGISYILPKSFGKAQTDQVPMEEMTLSTRLHCKSMPSGREERGNSGIKTIRNTRKNCITTIAFPPCLFIEGVKCKASLSPALFNNMIMKCCATLVIQAFHFPQWTLVADALFWPSRSSRNTAVRLMILFYFSVIPVQVCCAIGG